MLTDPVALRAALVQPVLTEHLPGTVLEAGSAEVNGMDSELCLLSAFSAVEAWQSAR